MRSIIYGYLYNIKHKEFGNTIWNRKKYLLQYNAIRVQSNMSGESFVEKVDAIIPLKFNITFVFKGFKMQPKSKE